MWVLPTPCRYFSQFLSSCGWGWRLSHARTQLTVLEHTNADTDSMLAVLEPAQVGAAGQTFLRNFQDFHPAA